MSLGFHQALADDARELREEAEAERRKQTTTIRSRRFSKDDGPTAFLDINTHLNGASARRNSVIGANSVKAEPASPTKPGASSDRDGDVFTDSQPQTQQQTSATFASSDQTRETQQTNSTSEQNTPSITKSPVAERAMASVYGTSKIRLPGDLGPNDPRNPRKSLPGDLGPNDPRRPRSTASKSQSPAGRLLEGQVDTKTRKKRPRRASDGALLRPEGSDRLRKDVDEEGQEDSSDEDNGGRGRSAVRSDSEDDDDNGRGRSPVPGGPPRSPNILITPPPSRNESQRTSGVHPHSAYDHPLRSGRSTPHPEAEEHLSDVRRAQRLALTVSPVHSTPSAHRVIRQVIRGDYTYFQREAEEGRRRQRVYLVATDLSPEAEYALEWTIGTVLRDGDTLLAVYAVDEESSGSGEGVEIGHGAEVIRDTASIVGSLPAEKVAQSPRPSGLGTNGKLPREISTVRLTQEHEGMSRAERERFRAANDISDRCIKLLRKTRLQIRVVVEVFHCKSPKHMITEVIDFLSPTMTVLGSRGRSALKGVLLGSFSNYLVTKSSVPVMVARRRQDPPSHPQSQSH
ncbi:hypothetical protein MBLNU457_6749t1 [Dothideomycetes sp. NU457]